MNQTGFYIVIFSLMNALFAFGTPLDIGAKAPEVQSIDQDGKEFSLKDAYQKDWVLVYFYPKADTPGCTKQACNLRDSFEELTKKGITVIGVSADKPEAQKNFKEKYQLPFTLLADSEHKVIDAFGVPQVLGKLIFARQSFLIHKGVIVWRDLKAVPLKQSQDVLAALEKLEKEKTP